MRTLAFGLVPSEVTITLAQLRQEIPDVDDDSSAPDPNGPATENVPVPWTLIGPAIEAGEHTLEGDAVLRIARLTLDGQPVDVGPNCATSTPVHVALRGQAGYIPVEGGTLAGVVNIPSFTGCGTNGEDLGPLIASMVSGAGNTLEIKQSDIAVSAAVAEDHPRPVPHSGGLSMGATVEVEGLTKSFGSQNIWRDVTLTLPPGEITALLGPSGTGKSVFLKTVMGLLHPEEGSVKIDGVDIVSATDRETQELRKRFGVLFQDGALFGSMSIYDNVAFPLHEHTDLSASEIKRKVGRSSSSWASPAPRTSCPARSPAACASASAWRARSCSTPTIILCDEPDSGLDPVRTAYIAQLLVDVNTETDATILVVTHDTNLARTLPDNLGMLFRRELVMFGPREAMLTTDEPAVTQFIHGSPVGPIGMSEEKDATPHHLLGAMDHLKLGDVPPQIQPSEGMGERAGAVRHAERLRTTPDIEELVVRQPDKELERRPVTRPPAYSGPMRGLRQVGSLFALALDVIVNIFRRPFQWRETLEQFWFIASVSILPAALVADPFGAVIALQLGTLTVQLGAQSFTGAASVLAVIQQAQSHRDRAARSPGPVARRSAPTWVLARSARRSTPWRCSASRPSSAWSCRGCSPRCWSRSCSTAWSRSSA